MRLAGAVRRATCVVTLAGLVVLAPTLPVVAAVATTTPALPLPAVPAHLPAAIEPLAEYVPQTSCDPVARTGTDDLARLLTKTYPDTTAATTYACGTDGSVSEHYEGRAVDWMITARTAKQQAEVHAVLDWLLAPDAAGQPYAMARRLGVMYLIYDKKIWGAYRASQGWRPYPCSGVTACHENHLHISLSWNGAEGRTSFWSGKVATATDYGVCRPADLNWAGPYRGPRATPCPTYATVSAPADSTSAVQTLYRWSGAQVGSGSAGPVVSAIQTYLGLPVTARFDAATVTAVTAWKRAHGLPATAVVDAATWRALLASAPKPLSAAVVSALARYSGTVLKVGSKGAAVVELQRVLHVTANGTFGAATQAAVVAAQKAVALPATGVVTMPTWVALGAPPPHPSSPLARYVRTVLRQGSSGAAVKALQGAVHVTTDGAFGPKTLAAVRAAQKAHGLTVSGVVATDLWLALGA